MARYGYITHSELAHHGVKGQKWGIRRYQNPDGSLTAEGKRHYGTYAGYLSYGHKFNQMSNELSKHYKSRSSDKAFMDEYKRVGDTFENYLKGDRKSIKAGKKISKKYEKVGISKAVNSIEKKLNGLDVDIFTADDLEQSMENIFGLSWKDYERNPYEYDRIEQQIIKALEKKGYDLD